MGLVYYPALLERENTVTWELTGKIVGGSETASGAMPITSLGGGGLWKAQLADISIVSKDHVHAWRAIAAICDGGVQPIILSMCDKGFMPAPLVGGVPLYSLDGATHSDTATFSDSTDYDSDVVHATLDADADLRATAITINLAVGSDLQGGEHFSIDHQDLRWRLYRIGQAIDNGDGTFDCTIRPPLRAAVTAGTELQFDHPKCVMRLASVDAMDLSLNMRKRAQPTINFVEAFPPFPA